LIASAAGPPFLFFGGAQQAGRGGRPLTRRSAREGMGRGTFNDLFISPGFDIGDAPNAGTKIPWGKCARCTTYINVRGWKFRRLASLGYSSIEAK